MQVASPFEISRELTDTLRRLVGLKLSMVSNSGTMKEFHFGAPWLYRGRFVGQVTLHVQCPWRLERDGITITGSSDYFVRARSNTRDDWEPGSCTGHLQDERLRESLELAPGVASPAGAVGVIVLEALSSKRGDVVIRMSESHQLLLFAASSGSEEWRVFNPGDIASHVEFESGLRI